MIEARHGIFNCGGPQVALIFYNGEFVTWRSSKQRYAAVSSTESGYIALLDCIMKLCFFRHVLLDERNEASE